MKTETKPAKRTTKSIVPEPSPELRARLDKYIEMLKNGSFHRECMVETNLSWSEVQLEKTRNPEYAALFKAAEAVRDERMKAERYEAAHERATKGVRKSVTTPAGIVGYDYVPSDRLLEVLLKRDAPEEYMERQSTKVDIATTFGNILAEIEKESIGPSSEQPLIEAHSEEPEA